MPDAHPLPLRRDRWFRRTGITFLLAAFVARSVTGASQAAEGKTAAFYVTSHGWHTGLIVPRAAIPARAWPPGVVTRDFAGCAYLELGWGDRKFYQAKHPGVLLALDAAFLPGPSVLHLVGLNPPLAGTPAWTALVAVPCTPGELTRLCWDLGRSFEPDARGRCQRLGPGLYGVKSGFYPARENYWIGDTCNHWTARELRAAGLPAHPDFLRASTAGQVVRQTRQLVKKRAR